MGIDPNKLALGIIALCASCLVAFGFSLLLGTLTGN